MGFRFRKSIGLGKFGRINIGKKGVSSVTLGKRGAPHVTVGRNGTSVGASIPGTGFSYEKRVGRHSGGRGGSGGEQVAETTQVMPAVTQPAPPDPATRVMAPVVPPAAGSQLPSDGANGDGAARGGKHGGSGKSNKPKKPWYKRWWVWMLTVLFVVGGASYALEPSAEVPNVVGMNAVEARTALTSKGFTKISFNPLATGDEALWIVQSQTPANGNRKTSETVNLTIDKDLSGIPDVVQAGMTLTAAESALTESGYTEDDYAIASDDGKTVTDASRYTVVSVAAGDPPTIRVHDSKADEEAAAAQKAAEEAEAAAKKAAEEEAAKKAAEEEAAKEEAAQKKAEEEAAKKAAQEQAQKQQSSATPKPTPTPQKTTSSGSGSGGSGSGSGSGSSSGGSSTSGSGVLVAICKDGTQSTSSPGAKDYRGMCSGHGGIAQKLGRR